MSSLHFANLIFFKTQLMFCLACYYSYQELLMDMQSCSTSKYGSLTDVTRISIKELYLNFLFSMFCNTGVKKNIVLWYEAWLHN